MKKKQLVGIINCTPDSFFTNSRFATAEQAISAAMQMYAEGASVVDIGGVSTRPGSDATVSLEEELQRILPVIEGIRKLTDAPLSIDTYRPEVAEKALEAGANWINDITGFSNKRMREVAMRFEATCVVVHMLGEPHSSPIPNYPRGVVTEIYSFLETRAHLLLKEGISPSKIILDPGIGGGAFGQSPDDSLLVLKNLRQFSKLGFPLLIGLSRKSFLQKILQKEPFQLLSTTVALNTMALLEGATYVRVHDVAAHQEILTVLDRLETL